MKILLALILSVNSTIIDADTVIPNINHTCIDEAGVLLSHDISTAIQEPGNELFADKNVLYKISKMKRMSRVAKYATFAVFVSALGAISSNFINKRYMKTSFEQKEEVLDADMSISTVDSYDEVSALDTSDVTEYERTMYAKNDSNKDGLLRINVPGIVQSRDCPLYDTGVYDKTTAENLRTDRYATSAMPLCTASDALSVFYPKLRLLDYVSIDKPNRDSKVACISYNISPVMRSLFEKAQIDRSFLDNNNLCIITHGMDVLTLNRKVYSIEDKKTELQRKMSIIFNIEESVSRDALSLSLQTHHSHASLTALSQAVTMSSILQMQALERVKLIVWQLYQPLVRTDLAFVDFVDVYSFLTEEREWNDVEQKMGLDLDEKSNAMHDSANHSMYVNDHALHISSVRKKTRKHVRAVDNQKSVLAIDSSVITMEQKVDNDTVQRDVPEIDTVKHDADMLKVLSMKLPNEMHGKRSSSADSRFCPNTELTQKNTAENASNTSTVLSPSSAKYRSASCNKDNRSKSMPGISANSTPVKKDARSKSVPSADVPSAPNMFF